MQTKAMEQIREILNQFTGQAGRKKIVGSGSVSRECVGCVILAFPLTFSADIVSDELPAEADTTITDEVVNGDNSPVLMDWNGHLENIVQTTGTAIWLFR